MTRFDFDPRTVRKLRAKPVQRERAEQIALFHWADALKSKHPALEMMFAIPNGGSRNKREALNLKWAGVKAGVPDIFLAYPTVNSQYEEGFCGLFIEMKSLKGKPTEEQEKWLNNLKGESGWGYQTAICYSWQEAAKVICEYLEINPKEAGL